MLENGAGCPNSRILFNSKLSYDKFSYILHGKHTGHTAADLHGYHTVAVTTSKHKYELKAKLAKQVNDLYKKIKNLRGLN